LNVLKPMRTKPLVAFTTARFQCRDFVPEDRANAINLNIFSEPPEFEQILQWQTSRPRVNFQLAVFEAGTEMLVGTAGVLMEGRSGGDAELILNLAYTSRGKYAVAFEIGYGLINWAFDALSLTQISVHISEKQTTSQKLAQYAKFSRVAKESETNMQIWRLSYGTWADHAEKLWKNHGTQNH
jgi:RimJ/RimL family protein N-acetyltransferase